METTLHRLFSSLLREGRLEVAYPSGRRETYGEGPLVSAVRFTDRRAMAQVAHDPQLGVGEMYMDGRLIVEHGTIYDFISLTKRNASPRALTAGAVGHHLWRSAGASVRRRAGLSAARRNIAHHYDLDERLFRLFLDPDMNYSCAYFEHDGQDLASAQLAKQRHIAGKLLTSPGERSIDLGSGWGGMGLYLAEVCEQIVTGVTLSQEQARVARDRARSRNANATYLIQDYRHARGHYDHVVSIGALEHIGLPQMQTFFDKVAELLDKKGTALIHSMGRTKPALYSQPFGEKYIFPGGYIPALSEVIPAAERAGLLVKDVEILPLHYAETCRIWRQNFLANREAVLELYDERFLRMWEIYLAASEASFRHDRIFVFHLLLARHQDRIPIRRGWLEPEKERLLEREATRAQISPQPVASAA